MSFDQDDLDRVQDYLQEGHQRFDAIPKRQKLRSFTIICLILNRTIGSGIFVTPSKVLKGTNSVGISLLLWPLGGFVATCGLLVWLEFGFSIPRREVQPGVERSVPRSGGEKNYLEFVLRSPRFLATCMYGVVFVILGNLSGNAVAFGTYVMVAAGNQEPSRGASIGLSIGALTAACLLHVCSRRGGIFLNNVFAMLKVGILLTIIIIGFAVAGGAKFGGVSSQSENFAISKSFAHPRKDVVSYTDSMLYVVYTYSGFEQPFYILGEVHRPKRNFAKACLSAMAIAITLFTLVNVAYLCAVSKETQLNNDLDIATLFFLRVFDTDTASRVMSALIALSIFGNIIVMTFTASKVKQEIAKEGILPFSMFFATGTNTPDALIKAWWNRRNNPHSRERTRSIHTDVERNPEFEGSQYEQSPMAALLLHWITSVFLIAVTSMLTAEIAYNFLVSLYSYVIIVMMGFLVATGLLYLKFSNHRLWAEKAAFKPWGGSTAAFVYSISCCFLLITAFLRPSDSSYYSYRYQHIEWFLIPTIGLSTLTWGVIWFGGLQFVMWRRGQQLIVTRVPYIEQDEEDGEWVMRSEVIDHAWQSNTSSRRKVMNDAISEDEVKGVRVATRLSAR
ncbi:hypothetical protein MMC25_007232 [Agyrium rufum]|nr:hypothetical protein [Agyrium rufum]